MIKFAAESRANGNKVIGLGLSRENCRRLLEGQPILVDGVEVNCPGVEILLFAGETEAELVRQFQGFARNAGRGG
jgi:hypothetical protein